MSQTQDAYRSTSTPPKTPRWVKALGAVVLILVLLVGVMLLSGHNPMQHMMHGGDPAATQVTGQQP